MRAAIGEAQCWKFPIGDVGFPVRRVIPCGDDLAACCDRNGPLRLMSAKLDKQLLVPSAPPKLHADATAPSFSTSSSLGLGAHDGASTNYCLSVAVADGGDDPNEPRLLWCGWSSGHVTVVRADSGAALDVLYAHRGAVHCVSSHNSLVLTSASDHTTIVWDGALRQVLKTLTTALQQAALLRSVNWWTHPQALAPGTNRLGWAILADDSGTVRGVDLDAVAAGGVSAADATCPLLAMAPSAARCAAVDDFDGLWAGAESGVVAFVQLPPPMGSADAKKRSRGVSASKAAIKLKHGAITALCALPTAMPQVEGTRVALAGCADSLIVAVQANCVNAPPSAGSSSSGDAAVRIVPLFSIPFAATVAQITPIRSGAAPFTYVVDRTGNVSVIFFPIGASGGLDDGGFSGAVSNARAATRGLTAADREAAVRAVEKRYEARLREMLGVVHDARAAATGCEETVARSAAAQEALATEVAQLRTECVALASALERSTEQLATARGEVRAAGAQSADALAESIKLNAECGAQARLLETMKADEQRHQRQIDALRAELRAMDDALAAKERAAAEADERLRAERRKHDEQLELARIDRDRVEKADRTLAAAAERAARAEALVETLRQQLRAEAEAHAKTQLLVDEQGQLLHELGAANNQLRADLDTAIVAANIARTRQAIHQHSSAPPRPQLESPQRLPAAAQQSSAAHIPPPPLAAARGARGVQIDM